MSQLVEQDDEIDLGELFAAIWYNWWIVGLATLVSVSLAGYYAFVAATPEFEASTRFELLDGDDGGSGLGQAAGLASLAGISLGGSASAADSMQDRILSRPFIESVYKDAEFVLDPVFNGRLSEPGLVAKFREIVLGPAEAKDLTRDDYLVMAIGALRERMTVSLGDNGIIELTISHPDGNRAADVANTIVEQSLFDIFERERNETRESLNYFADELLQVRSDLDAANAAVRDYAISNSLQSAEELARTSSQLAQVRRDIEVIDDSILALEKMSGQEFDGPKFAQAYPVSTNLSFRRLLGFSGDPNSWERPSSEELALARARLEAQKSPLISSFNALEARAQSSGAEALELAALRREVAVQQAVYESVITQFESRSLFSGFEQASGRIIESAIAPNNPTSPKKPLILALGMMLGLFSGAALALMVSMKRGRLYTFSAIRDCFALSDVRRGERYRFGKVNSSELTKKQLTYHQDLLVSLDESDKIVAFCATNSNDLVGRLALNLSKASSKIGAKSALLDLSAGVFGIMTKGVSGTQDNILSKYDVLSGVDLYVPESSDAFLKQTECQAQLDSLKKDYDRVLVVLPSPQDGTAITRVVSQLTDVAIIVAERARTTRASVDAIKSILSSKISDPLLVIV